MRAVRFLLPSLLVTVLAIPGIAAKPPAAGGVHSITPADMKEWLGYVASDELEGRQIFTEGLGLAATYIADHLREWGVKPAGDDGTYFQTVKVLGVRTNSNASVTVNVNGKTRTFKDGEGVLFSKNMGGKQTITGDDILFVGYGLQVPTAGIDDYANVDPKGKVIVFMGQGPSTLPQGSGRLLAARSRLALEKGARAVIGTPGFGRGGGARGAAPQPSPAPAQAQAGAAPTQAAPAPQQPAQAGQPAPAAQSGRGGGRGGFGTPDNGDFTTVQHYDLPVTPSITAQDEFFEFLFSDAAVKYPELKDKIAKQEPLPSFALKGVKLTLNVDAEYTVVRTRLTRNVVGIVPGTDQKLKDSYVAFGAHYDHIGYRENAVAGFFSGPGVNAGGCIGQTRPAPKPGDIINNGADDDGSGTVALMALARAYAQGPKPKRSLLFVWHSGEEAGLFGSRFEADYPVVPIQNIVAVLNMDMVGRNRCDQESEANTIYVVGSDRISTELHNLNEDANASMPKPMKLDYEMNDPADPESIYTRSDHYSYAVKGIPIIFYTTGLHRDYHFLTDEVEKIEFPKMAKITQLVYTTGMRVANLDHAPVRDNKGPRLGKGKTGKIQ